MSRKIRLDLCEEGKDVSIVNCFSCEMFHIVQCENWIPSLKDSSNKADVAEAYCAVGIIGQSCFYIQEH